MPAEFQKAIDLTLITLIKKRAKDNGLLEAISNIQLINEHSKNSTYGQLRKQNPSHSHLKIANKQSTLCHSESKIIHLIHRQNMSRRSETCSFKGGFIPAELKRSDPPKQNTEATTKWQGSSDREESLSDPRWHKRPPVKGKKNSPKTSKAESATQVQDAREVIKKAEETRRKSNFPIIIFTDNTTKNNDKPIVRSKRKRRTE